MQLQTAEQAAAIVQQLATLQQIQQSVQAGLQAGGTISHVSISGADAIDFSPLAFTPQETAQIAAAVGTVLQARADALSGQLAGL